MCNSTNDRYYTCKLNCIMISFTQVFLLCFGLSAIMILLHYVDALNYNIKNRANCSFSLIYSEKISADFALAALYLNTICTIIEICVWNNYLESDELQQRFRYK